MRDMKISKYELNLEKLFKEKEERAVNVTDESIRIIYLNSGGSIICTDGEYYELYNNMGDMVFSDKEVVLLIKQEISLFFDDKHDYVIIGYNGDSAKHYKFRKDEWDIIASEVGM